MRHHLLGIATALLIAGACGSEAQGGPPPKPPNVAFPQPSRKSENASQGQSRWEHKVEIGVGSHWGWKVLFGVLFAGAVAAHVRDTRRKSRAATAEKIESSGTDPARPARG